MSFKNILLPDLGEGVTEGEILKIKVKEGDFIAMDQVLVEVMTDKASMEIPSSIEGVVKKIEVSEGDIVSVGTSLFLIQIEESSQNSSADISRSEEDKKTSSPPSQKNHNSLELQKQEEVLSFKTQEKLGDFPSAIPMTRKLAKDLGIDLKKIFKNHDKVTRSELVAYVREQLQSSEKKVLNSLDGQISFKEKKRIPLKGISRLMFESMTLSKKTIPHFTIGEQAQIDYLIQLKTEMKARIEERGLKLGFLPFFIKALIPVIKEFPLFNAVYDDLAKEIVFKEDLNVGFAVDSPQGLLVPVIKEVQNKSLLEIIKEVFEKVQQTRDFSIKREDLKGASLTLTNLGSLGGMYATPIIQAPEMAILGIYKIFKQAVLNKSGEFEEKNFINFSITCDHRFIDGATATRFLKSFVQKIEEPSLLLF
ncbi:MAG: 2-oxo acid dehydrogenase subunit E2 [Bdellovibrionales bacterium]|nr:2-oxo acid dehydrogenase subunit E2 [Bdellovibrionales bacterium]